MRIAFDHQAFCLQKTGGISRYFVRVAQELAYVQQQVGVFAPLYRNQYLNDLDKSYIRGRRIQNYPPHCADAMVSLNGFVARSLIRQWQPDVVHETYFSKRASGTQICPSVLTVFDMIPELGIQSPPPSEYEVKQSAKYAAVLRADHVICISECTRQDLIEQFNIFPEKVSTIHLGCDAIVNVKREALTHQSAARPYLLYVGLRDGYKNFERLLQAVACSKSLRDDVDVVAFGGGSFSTAELALIQRLNFAPNQIRQNSGSDQSLSEAYSGATAFVYPSIYEGFGLPPLEAMAHSCPVVSSNTSSMPEVIGDAAEYFDPLSIDDIASAIERVVLSDALTQSLIERGRLRAQRYTWKACAEQHLQRYEFLAQRATSR